MTIKEFNKFTKEIDSDAEICCIGNNTSYTEKIKSILFSEQKYDPYYLNTLNFKNKIDDVSKIKTIILVK